MAEDFMTAMVNKGVRAKPNAQVATGGEKPAKECSQCDGTNVVATSTEDGEGAQNRAVGANVEIGQAHHKSGTTTIAMKAPLGALMTQALLKSQPRLVAPADIKIGNEDIHAVRDTVVSANGQSLTRRPPQSTELRQKLLVGMLPAYGEEPTPLNAFLQAAGQCKWVDLVFVAESKQLENVSGAAVLADGNHGDHRGTTHVVEVAELPPGTVVDNVAIESVEVIIHYRKDQ